HSADRLSPVVVLTAGVCWSFFFEAEDGIRDFHVTGVQTCALPISPAPPARPLHPGLGHTGPGRRGRAGGAGAPPPRLTERRSGRSEERRVGKECRSRGARLRG